MTASLAPDPPPIAPQAISEQHTMVVETIQKRELWRFWMIVFFFGALSLMVIGPLIVHQVFQFGAAPAAGVAHQGQSPRGVIVDRNGALLAADRYFYQVTATPKNIKDDAQRLEVAQQLEQLAELPIAKTVKLLTEYQDALYVELAPAISLEQGQRVLDEQERLAKKVGLFPLLEVNLTPTPKRYYPEGELGAHLIGMLALSDESAWYEGYYGLEGYYNNFLRQRNNVGLTAKPDAQLTDLPAAVRQYLPSVAGKDLILTIDRRIQWIIEDELRTGLQKYRAQSGTIIVMEPHTGAILALASWPTFDPNDVGKSEPGALQNAAISAQYEPGSVFKVVTAAAVLDTGLITPSQKLTDTGSIAVGDRVIVNSSSYIAQKK